MAILSQEDHAVQAALTALDTHIATMTTSYNTAERINEDIAANYIADSSTTFQRQVEEWLTKCRAVRDLFQTLQDDLHGATSSISNADENALGIGGSWSGTSDATFSALTGN